jgi:hypothetical protein
LDPDSIARPPARLAAPLSVPEHLGAGAGGLLGNSAAAGQLHPTRRRHDQLSAHQQHQPQPATLCAANRREGLELQVGAWMMSCKIFKQSYKVQVQSFYQRDKTKSWSGLKLSSADGDWDVDLEQWLKYQGYYYEIFKQSCKVQRFNQRDKTKSWSFLNLHSADGDGDIDFELKLGCCCVTAKMYKQSCQFHVLIIDETTTVLLDSSANPHSNGIEIKFLSEGLPIEWLTEGIPTQLIWLRNGIMLCCN